jgi:hypothetical protein
MVGAAGEGEEGLNRPTRRAQRPNRAGVSHEVVWDRNSGGTTAADENGIKSDYLMSPATRREKIKILGSGVCPPVMQAIAEQLDAV